MDIVESASPQHMAIHKLDAVVADNAAKWVLFRYRGPQKYGERSLSALHLFELPNGLSLDEFRYSVLAWDILSFHKCGVLARGLEIGVQSTSRCQRLIHEIVACRAIGRVAGTVPGARGAEEDLHCLQFLEAEGILYCHNPMADHSTSYVLPAALGRLDLTVRVGKPRFVLEGRSGTMKERTSYELFVGLLDIGLELRVQPRGAGAKERKRATPPLPLGDLGACAPGSRPFFVNANTGFVARVYLQELHLCARQSELLQKGITFVKHIEKARYYSCIEWRESR